MKVYIITILVVLLIMVLLSYRFKIKFKFHVNFINQRSFYSVKVMFIKLLCGTAFINNDKLVVQNTHNIVYNAKMDTKQIMTNAKSIIKKIEISSIQLFFTGGIKNNAYATAMLCGYVYSISSALISILISNNNLINIFQDIDPSYNDNSLDITLDCLLKISIFDIIIGLIKGQKEYNKELKHGKKI